MPLTVFAKSVGASRSKSSTRQLHTWEGNLESQTIAAVRQRLGVDEASITFKSGYSQSSESFGYVKQQHNDIPFANAVAGVAFDSSFFSLASVSSLTFLRITEEKIASSTPIISLDTAVSYNVMPGGAVVLTHVVQVQNEATDACYEAFVDAHSGDVFVADASYHVLPINKMVIPEGLETIVDPQITAASPNGWRNDGSSESDSNTGNNVESSGRHVYTYVVDPDTEPNTTNNLDATRTNALYVSNMIHDITYLSGFTEAAYNFQNTNFDKGGKAEDKPRRDGSFENDIIAHELRHGLTNCMTGGGTGGCLQTTEAGSMGEGRSDTFADWLWQKKGTIQDYKLGWYVYKPEVIRAYPYSTDPYRRQPLEILNVKGNYAAHSIRTVWANMMHNVHAALLAAHRYSETAFTNPDAHADAGNVVFMRLFIDAWDPDFPSFFVVVNARDAWIQADANSYEGTHKCLIWKVFATKGLGANADNFVDNFDVPTECKDSAEEGGEPEEPEVPEFPEEEETISPGEGWL
ncbi:hypothetical protein BDN71DRAFT_1482979 [Pleurotus eryngii]|uniref:Extracellular metalloproteinase n=1 Tax=Pleurotus eryngii TaxID=5323 RepID=A0A9P5ZXV5_PLEER|nr:hypothetical protein BDN71DRAFT_1482979 [Pleurotus eryngii]